MSISMPRSVKEAWGEEATEDFAQWFETVQETNVSREEFRQVVSRLDVLEHDVGDIKQELRDVRREMNERFDRMNDQMNERFDRMNDQMNERFDRMNGRFDRMNGRFDEMYDRMMVMTRWTIGVIALFGTAVTILLAIAQFTP